MLKTVPAFASEEATAPYYMNADPPSAKGTWSYSIHKPVWMIRNYMPILLLNLLPLFLESRAPVLKNGGNKRTHDASRVYYSIS
jgi:hypothetical protein